MSAQPVTDLTLDAMTEFRGTLEAAVSGCDTIDCHPSHLLVLAQKVASHMHPIKKTAFLGSPAIVKLREAEKYQERMSRIMHPSMAVRASKNLDPDDINKLRVMLYQDELKEMNRLLREAHTYMQTARF